MTAKRRPTAQVPLFPDAPMPLSEADARRVDVLTEQLARIIDALPMSAKVDALNRARRALHHVSPFKSEPVDCVLWFPKEDVVANSHNPNSVAPPEMVALTHSMQKYGITMPIVGVRVAAAAEGLVQIRINDGFHRNVVVRTDPVVSARTLGYMPISLLKGDFSEADEMSATILHNQARGTHSVVKELAIVQRLDSEGWTDEQIGVGTVKSEEELVRMRQVGGAAKNLASASYANAWTFEK